MAFVALVLARRTARFSLIRFAGLGRVAVYGFPSERIVRRRVGMIPVTLRPYDRSHRRLRPVGFAGILCDPEAELDETGMRFGWVAFCR